MYEVSAASENRNIPIILETLIHIPALSIGRTNAQHHLSSIQILVSEYHSLLRRTLLEKRLITSLEQGKVEGSLKCLLPENDMSKATGTNLNGAPLTNSGIIRAPERKKVVKPYKP